MTAEKKFTEGQTVILVPGYSRGQEPVEYQIAKVGRTLVHIQINSWKTTAFEIATGAECRSPNAGGVGDHIYTLEEWADRKRRQEIRERLDAHGIRSGGYGDFKQPTDTLERILAVLDVAKEHTK